VGYSRRFAASATGFAHRRLQDPFFRTEASVVALQVLFALFLLAVVGIIAAQLYHDASAAVAQGIANALQPNSTPVSIGNTVITQLDYTRSRTVVFAAVAIFLITLLFTYVIARIALAPTRHALDSQKRFIGNIAHELRTPLSVIKTNTEVRLLDPTVTDAARSLHREVLEELDRISEIINNLLTLSSSIRPEHLEFSKVDLGPLIEKTLQQLHPLTERRHISVEVQMSDKRTVWGNTAALEQILMNVIKNAIQYSHKNGRIRIVVEPLYPDRMEIRIRDMGIGIEHGDLVHIFEPYYRTDPARARTHGGSGLGLTIVSELVKLHNGKITIRSQEGEGTTVVVILPARNGNGGTAGKEEAHGASEVAVDFS
jgi:signal transduction histidine kinase